MATIDMSSSTVRVAIHFSTATFIELDAFERRQSRCRQSTYFSLFFMLGSQLRLHYLPEYFIWVIRPRARDANVHAFHIIARKMRRDARIVHFLARLNGEQDVCNEQRHISVPRHEFSSSLRINKYHATKTDLYAISDSYILVYRGT